MNVTFLGEIERQRAITVVSSSFQIRDNIAKEGKRSEYADFFPENELVMFMIFHKKSN